MVEVEPGVNHLCLRRCTRGESRAGAAGALVESVWLTVDVARASRLRASSLDDGLYLNFVWYGSMGAGQPRTRRGFLLYGLPSKNPGIRANFALASLSPASAARRNQKTARLFDTSLPSSISKIA